jgi:hypothetical protein
MRYLVLPGFSRLDGNSSGWKKNLLPQKLTQKLTQKPLQISKNLTVNNEIFCSDGEGRN